MRPRHQFSEEAPGGGLLAVLYSRTSLVLLGLVAVAVAVGLLGLTTAVFTHSFEQPARVRLEVDRAGSQLSTGADVKISGIIVGRVSGITARSDGSGAVLDLALDRHFLGEIPANVTATIIPKTIFGEKYVDLRLPAEPTAARIADGATISPDRSSVALETSTVLNDLGPLLEAVDPADLARTLNAVATALRGQGNALGETLTAGRRFTDAFKPAVGDLVADAGLAGTVADSYDRAATPFLDTLRQTSTMARTLTAKQTQLARLLGSTGAFADVVRSFVGQVGPTGVQVVRVSRPVLALLAKYSPELACFVRGVVKAKSRLEAVFADGPYLKARLYVAVSRGTYKPGIDAPKSLDLSAYGPYCPITPKGDTGTVPWPVVPKELDQLRGQPQPLETVNGLPDVPGVPVNLSLPGTPTGGGPLVGRPSDLLGLLLGGPLG